MQVSSVDAVSRSIRDKVQVKYHGLFSEISGLSSEIEQLVLHWQQTSERLLLAENPYATHAVRLEHWKQQSAVGGINDARQLIGDFQSFSKLAQVPFDPDFWHHELSAEFKENSKDGDFQISSQLLLNDWQKKLDKALSAWQIEKLQTLRGKLLNQIEEWLNLLAELKKSLESLGLDSGIWLDMSKGELRSQEIEQLKRWAKYLAEDEGACAVCELLGKIRQVEKMERVESVKQTIAVGTPYVDVSSKEEIVGLRLGKDIEHALPSELALLSNPDTAILFDLKFLEARLTCFEMQGTLFAQEKQEVDVEQAESEEEKLGPMILCIDTSGSMRGEPEHIAKAMALYLATQARAQARKCYLINFSTDIETYELTGSEGFSRLIAFLGNSFHGGTDVAPALRQALHVMGQEGYRKADVLVISDFVMGALPKDVLTDIDNQRENGNMFNSLVVGDCFMFDRLHTHFDHEWVFNHQRGMIRELVQFKQKMFEPVMRCESLQLS